MVINLYPFRQTIAKPGVTREEAIENIDIGGPTMIRAAAKNWQDVVVMVDPADYEDVLAQLKTNGAVDEATHLRLAYKAVSYTHLDVYKRQDMPIVECPQVENITAPQAQTNTEMTAEKAGSFLEIKGTVDEKYIQPDTQIYVSVKDENTMETKTYETFDAETEDGEANGFQL